MPSTLTLGGGGAAGKRAGKPHLFLGLECERPWAGGARHLLGATDRVLLGRAADRTAARSVEGGERVLRLGVPDRRMSASHARVLHVLGRWVLEDAGSKNGSRVNGAPVRKAVLVDGDVVELGHTFFVFREALDAPPDAPRDLDAGAIEAPAAGLATLLPAFAAELARLATIARSEVAVVVRGESGTGKELIARAVHALSGRTGPFVALNCGALSESLLASELFGYRKGAFSGALEDRPGLVRAAHQGTLFLDEVGDLPPGSQAAFLRVLQEREVLPLGASQPVRVDVRLVTATHRDLAALVDDGRFRADLLARIAGFELVLPPLRERREDTGVLVADLVTRGRPPDAPPVTFAPEAARALFRHGVPLNIRELEKALAAAIVLAAPGPIELAHLPEAFRASLDAKVAPSSTSDRPPPAGEDDDGDSPELSARDLRQRDELIVLLREHTGNVSAIARVLGKARMQVQRWLKRYGLDPASFRG